MDINNRKPWGELTETARQDLCRHYVNAEVLQSLTPLITSVLALQYDSARAEEELDLHELREAFDGFDYEEAAKAENWLQTEDGTFYKAGDADDAEHCRLGGDMVGWSCIAEEEAEDENDPDADPTNVFTFEQGDNPDTRFQVEADDEDEAWIQICAEKGFTPVEENDDDLNDDWEDLCNHHGVDTDDYRHEPYEYWLVSDRMYRDLEDLGYLVTEWKWLNIWGRECTGQSICLDEVISTICKRLYTESCYFPIELLEQCQ